MLRSDRLGLALRFIRSQRRLRQRDVAAKAGITSSMLSGYENGRKLPTLSSLDKILEALDCSLRELVDTLEQQAPRSRGEPARDGSPPGPDQAPAISLLRRVERSPLPRLQFDLRAIFGASAELDREEERAFGEMLQGYCRWLRFLRDSRGATSDEGSSKPAGEVVDEARDEAGSPSS